MMYNGVPMSEILVVSVASLYMQCLDFSITLYFLHLVVCVLYSGIPHSWAWWLTNVVCLIITAVFGEYLCMRTELAAIPVGGSQNKT